MDELFSTQILVSFLALLALEIVLGIDNVIFIAILSEKLPESQQSQARRLGIGLAVLMRIILLLGITWVMQLTTPLFSIFAAEVSGRDLILIIGGAFLIGKSTFEIHEKIEASEHGGGSAPAHVSFASVIIQVVLMDVIFSLDSVITAVGISGVLWVMITAIVIAAAVMVVFAERIADFVERHPTMKILALAFLILIGMMLLVEGWAPEVVHDFHLKNYAYFAMAFSLVVEFINIRVRKQSNPMRLHNRPRLSQKA